MKASKIGIWASSSPAKLGDIQRGIQRLLQLEMGFSFTEKDKALSTTTESRNRPYLASNEQNKIVSLEILANDKLVNNIFAVRGGYGSIRLLKHLSRGLLNKLKKKVIWGFSDLTTIQNALFFVNGQKWVHSPMLTSDAFIKPSSIEKKYWNMLVSGTSDQLQYEIRSETPFAPSNLSALKSKLLIGGNLACFAALAGTGTFFKLPAKPFVLMLEDVGEKPHRIDRLLTQLFLAGVFKNCKGIVLGHFTDCGDWLGVFKGFCAENKIPLFWGLKAGHDRPNLPIPMGQKISIVKKSANKYILRVPNSRFE